MHDPGPYSRTVFGGVVAVAVCSALVLEGCGSRASERTLDGDEADGGEMDGSVGGAGGDQAGGESGKSSGGTGTAAGGTGAGSGSAGASGMGGAPGACDPACPSQTPICAEGVCVECMEVSKRCAGGTPQECQGGAWVSLAACPVDAPACTNGVCALARTTGGLVTVQSGAGAGDIRLRDHGFEFLPRACADVAGVTVCVSGGLR